MNLTLAHTQWANRPDDERFASIPDMLAAAQKKKDYSVQSTNRMGSIRVDALDADSLVVRRNGLPDAAINNYAFGQLCNRLDYPVGGIVGKVDANIAASIINHRLSKIDPDTEVQTLVDCQDGNVNIRSVTSDSYARFYDADVIRSALAMERAGWIVPPARPAFEGQKGTRKATEDDVKRMAGRTNVKVGDNIAPAGLYMGDRDMFMLLVNPGTEVDRGDGNAICRATIIWNSEVGARTFGVLQCALDYVCGNHILWSVRDVQVTRYRHIGEAVDRINKSLEVMAQRTVDPLDEELSIIREGLKYSLGDTLDKVVDNVYALRVDPALTKDILTKSIHNAEQYRSVDGDPYTLIGLERAITRYSQSLPNADKRYAVDNAAGKMVRKFIDKGLITV